MNTKRLVTIAVAAMFLIGGVAAVGAATPTDQANENATDAHEADAPADATDDDGDGVGPSDGLPEQASDRVTEIHETIDAYLDGSIDRLGDSLSDLLGDEEATDEDDTDANDEDDTDANDDGEASDA